MKEKILELQGVTKEYKSGNSVTKALDDITFSLEVNESLAVIGPSGSGKSTFLNLVGGLDKPTSGTVLINNMNVNKMNDKQLSQFRNKTIGFIFQFFNLQDYLKAYENVMIPLLFSGIKPQKAKEKAMELLKIVGMNHRSNYYPNQLSGGEMQRVAIARSLANDPKILLADEPTANLDRKSSENVLSIFQDISKKGVSVVVITHDPFVSEKFDNVLHLSDGHIAE